MPQTDNRFEGRWQLVPELCQYQDGHPPRSGQYDIQCNDTDVTCVTSWVDEHDKSHTLTYGGPMDGTVIALKGNKLEASFTRIDAYRLDSSSYFDGRETAYAHRKVSQDHSLMVVLMVHHHKEDRSTRNFQIYRRAG